MEIESHKPNWSLTFVIIFRSTLKSIILYTLYVGFIFTFIVKSFVHKIMGFKWIKDFDINLIVIIFGIANTFFLLLKVEPESNIFFLK